MSISDRIYQIIEKKNLKQSSIAEAAGYTSRQFNDMLKGRKQITAKDISPLCRVLGITPNELFGYEQKAS